MISKGICSAEQLKELAFSKEELDELAHARSRPITFDEDCPEVQPEQVNIFQRVNETAAAPE